MIENPTEEQLLKIEGIIYLIINNITQQKYIGKSIKSFNRRYSKTWWKSSHMNNYIKKSIKKYGYKNFSVILLDINIKNDDLLYELEKNYIKQYNCIFPNGYNFNEGGKNNVVMGSLVNNAKNECKYLLKWIETGDTFEIKSIREFCKEFNFCQTCINDVLRGDKICAYKKLCLPETTKEDIVNYYKQIAINAGLKRKGRKQTEKTKNKRRQSMLAKHLKKPLEERRLISERMKKSGVSQATREGHKQYFLNRRKLLNN